MKAFVFLFLTSVSVAGQVPDKIKVITFDRADAEHCSVVMIEGRPMLQTAYSGTSVAVGLPVSTGPGDFRVFVVVRRTGAGKARVKPRDFSALYSDPAHTKFPAFDKAAGLDHRAGQPEGNEAGIIAASSQGDLGLQGVARTPGPVDDIDRQARALRTSCEDPNATVRQQEQTREGTQTESSRGVTVPPDQLYLRAATVRQGTQAEGFVYFRKPKGSKLNIGPRDLLYEIDIPVGGVVFRFS
jgi:hypothetical protein